MREFEKTKLNNQDSILSSMPKLSNPLSPSSESQEILLTNYTKTLPRTSHDKDMSEIVEVVRIMNNMAPIRMPQYNFNIDEINGERYYRPDGTLLLVREYDGDVIRDYYSASMYEDTPFTVSRILEHSKVTGRLRTKIEPIQRKGSRLRTNITIFDLKVNNKYIIIQLTEDGTVNNISEFSGKGKSFQTLFRNAITLKPARYLEGKDDPEKGFEMIDAIFAEDGKIARIKRYTSKTEINIEYTETSKNITVKNKV